MRIPAQTRLPGDSAPSLRAVWAPRRRDLASDLLAVVSSGTSLLGRAFAQRLVTQMYFPGDPLFPYDPIFNSVRDPAARERMISHFSIHETVPNWALAYEFDICLRGPGQTPFEEAH